MSVASENSPAASEPVARRSRIGRGRPWTHAGLVTSVSGAAIAFAFSPLAMGPARALPIMGGSYALLAAGACAFLHRRGELRRVLAPRRLDITLGALTALILYLVTNLGALLLLRGRPQEDWLWRAYVQLGRPAEIATPVVGIALLVVAALEEIVWRGWAMRALTLAYGGRRGLLYATALYGLAHAPTVWLLRVPDAGYNPLVAGAALFWGLVWGAIALRFDRLGPSLFSHAICTWATLLFPLWSR